MHVNCIKICATLFSFFRTREFQIDPNLLYPVALMHVIKSMRYSVFSLLYDGFLVI